jgi:hypothetical protein
MCNSSHQIIIISLITRVFLSMIWCHPHYRIALPEFRIVPSMSIPYQHYTICHSWFDLNFQLPSFVVPRCMYNVQGASWYVPTPFNSWKKNVEVFFDWSLYNYPNHDSLEQCIITQRMQYYSFICDWWDIDELFFQYSGRKKIFVQ